MKKTLKYLFLPFTIFEQVYWKILSASIFGAELYAAWLLYKDELYISNWNVWVNVIIATYLMHWILAFFIAIVIVFRTFK